MIREFPLRGGLVLAALLALAACDEQGFDFDLRDEFGATSIDTTSAARSAVSHRPRPDNRGVISYPSYQVAVSRRGDTVSDVANRVGLPAAELSTYNGIPMDAELRRGEIIALPRRVAEPSPATGSATVGPIVAPEDAPQALAAAAASQQVDVETLAEDAISRAETTTPAPAPAPKDAPKIATGEEPVQHKVARGETAYSIARRYGVPVGALAEWNGLDSNFTVREGQYLLIPVTDPNVTVQSAAAASATTEKPGQGSTAPLPPSSAEPLPDPAEATPAPSSATPAAPDLSQETTASSASDARMIYPASGKVVRAYQKGRNDGIDIATTAGASVVAADSGSVAAITRDTDQVPILVLRHADNVLTVYAGVDQIAVNKGDKVKRGQEIAKVRAAVSPILHFEVRDGFDSVDPALYLE